MNEILLGDCLDLFKEIPDNSVDVSFVDPPFNLNKKYKTYEDNLTNKKYIQWCEQWLVEMVRVTRGSLFIHNIHKWMTQYTSLLNQKMEFKHWIAWYAPTSPMGSSLQPAHYGILYYAKHNAKFYEIRHPNKRCKTCSHLLRDYGGKKNTDRKSVV